MQPAVQPALEPLPGGVAGSAPASKSRKSSRGDVRYPTYGLGDAVMVAKAIHEKGGGVATKEQLAAYLDHKTTNSGAFLSRVGAARLFGLIDNRGGQFVLLPLAQRILMPTYQNDAKEALVEAFFNVPLFKAIYDEHHGRELPPEFGMKNLFRTKFNIDAERAQIAYRVLMESADVAGFFSTRGARTHLIIPQVGGAVRAAPSQTMEANAARRETGGSGGGTGSPPPPGEQVAAGSIRERYVEKLISLLGTEGVDNQELMDRIERLLVEPK